MQKSTIIPEISTPFIPYQIFNGNFLPVLSDLIQREIITWTESEMLRILNGYAYKDGKCYPGQDTLEADIGLSNSQVRRTLKSLENKGLIEIDRPSPLQRRMFRKNNSYKFLFHSCYLQYLEPASEPEAESVPEPTDIKENTEINAGMNTEQYNISLNSESLKEPRPAAPSLSSNSQKKPEQIYNVGNQAIKEEIESICRQIIIKEHEMGGSRFNPAQFGQMNLKNYTPEAVAYALDAVLKKMESCDCPEIFKAFDFFGYGKKVIDREGRNMNEARHIEEARKHMEDLKAAAEAIFNKCVPFPA